MNFSFLKIRWKILALLNGVFFGGVFITLVLASISIPPQLYTGWQPNLPGLFVNAGWLGIMLGIFVFNLVLSGFVIVTLPGMILFPSSAGFLLYRAYIWGVFLNSLPSWVFLIALPVVLFEGESYVLAGVAGTLIGASWIAPQRLYPEEELSRFAALRRAFRESGSIYVLLSIFLISAAIIETTIITF